MSLGDFYQKHLNQNKFRYKLKTKNYKSHKLKKSVASKMVLFGSTYLCEVFFSN